MERRARWKPFIGIRLRLQSYRHLRVVRQIHLLSSTSRSSSAFYSLILSLPDPLSLPSRIHYFSKPCQVFKAPEARIASYLNLADTRDSKTSFWEAATRQIIGPTLAFLKHLLKMKRYHSFMSLQYMPSRPYLCLMGVAYRQRPC